MLIRRKHIRAVALELLESHHVKKPPVPVDAIAQRMGAAVIKKHSDSEISGFILRDSAKNEVIIGVNESHHPNRQRFTVAHELGHLLLHRGEELHIDKR